MAELVNIDNEVSEFDAVEELAKEQSAKEQAVQKNDSVLDDLDIQEAKKKMISDIKDEYSSLIPNSYSSQISGCQKTAGCNRLYSIIVNKSNTYYLIQFENNTKDEIYANILKNITIK